MEMVRYSNKTTQASVVRFISEADKEAKVLLYFRFRVRTASAFLVERQAAGTGPAGTYERLTGPQEAEFATATRALGLLKLLMEGHFLPMQELLRTQPFRESDINLVAAVTDLFVLQAGSSASLMAMTDADISLLTITIMVRSLRPMSQSACRLRNCASPWDQRGARVG